MYLYSTYKYPYKLEQTDISRYLSYKLIFNKNNKLTLESGLWTIACSYVQYIHNLIHSIQILSSLLRTLV